MRWIKVVLLSYIAGSATYFLTRPPKATRVMIGGGTRPQLDSAKAVNHPSQLQELNFRTQADHLASSTSIGSLEGKDAPDFTLPATTGGQVSLDELAKGKPVLIFFVEKECPCCVGAKPFLERVRYKYEDVLNTVAIINADQPRADKWAKAVTALFPVLIDPELKVARAYKAERGAYTMLVSKSPSKIIKAYPGYSRSMLEDLGAAIAKESGVPLRPIDTDGAPEKMVTGCLFPQTKP